MALLFRSDHMKASDEDLEIAGNNWESISGKKILVHEFDGPASIDGFRSQEIESVSEELASAKKIEQLKVYMIYIIFTRMGLLDIGSTMNNMNICIKSDSR